MENIQNVFFYVPQLLLFILNWQIGAVVRVELYFIFDMNENGAVMDRSTVCSMFNNMPIVQLMKHLSKLLSHYSHI